MVPAAAASLARRRRRGRACTEQTDYGQQKILYDAISGKRGQNRPATHGPLPPSPLAANLSGEGGWLAGDVERTMNNETQGENERTLVLVGVERLRSQHTSMMAGLSGGSTTSRRARTSRCATGSGGGLHTPLPMFSCAAWRLCCAPISKGRSCPCGGVGGPQASGLGGCCCSRGACI